jgi:hypothetical protein
MSDWQDQLGLHNIYLQARSRRNAFFEKLALLDGGTVALVITAVLGPLRGVIVAKMFLCVGLSILVLAMLVLLYRNYLAPKYEAYAAAETAKDYLGDRKVGERMAALGKRISRVEQTGAVLSALGVVLLLIEVWIILIGSSGTQRIPPI